MSWSLLNELCPYKKDALHPMRHIRLNCLDLEHVISQINVVPLAILGCGCDWAVLGSSVLDDNRVKPEVM